MREREGSLQAPQSNTCEWSGKNEILRVEGRGERRPRKERT